MRLEPAAELRAVRLMHDGRLEGKESRMGLILLILLVVILLGALPTWPHSRGWGYYPSGGVGLVLLILIILLLTRRI